MTENRPNSKCAIRESFLQGKPTHTHTHAEEHVRLTFIFLFLHIEEHTIHFHEIKIFVRILIQFDIQYFLEMRELYIFVIHYDSDTMNNKKKSENSDFVRQKK